MFLNKTKATLKGRITNTAILLLGKPESTVHLTGGAVSRLTWILKNREEVNISHEHFTSPMILAVDKLFRKIRRIKYQYMSGDTLFPDEVDNYDEFTIREALNNCIAHQDYRLQSRITVVEKEDSLEFSNAGTFLPSSIENVVADNSPQRYYRNRLLVEAMDAYNMIETAGNGIPKLFNIQAQKFFPLPDYELGSDMVRVEIIGKVLDMEYAKKIASIPDIDLPTIILVDKVHRKRAITREQVEILRQRKLIEGRYPNIYISRKVAEHTKDATTYLNAKGVDGPMIERTILDILRINKIAKPQYIYDHLIDRLPASFTPTQKEKKIENALQKLRTQQKIKFDRHSRNWVFVKKS